LRILDHHALCGQHAQIGRRRQEDIGGRLAMRKITPAHIRIEHIQQG
jgi:hypothetical protein